MAFVKTLYFYCRKCGLLKFPFWIELGLVFTFQQLLKSIFSHYTDGIYSYRCFSSRVLSPPWGWAQRDWMQNQDVILRLCFTMHWQSGETWKAVTWFHCFWKTADVSIRQMLTVLQGWTLLFFVLSDFFYIKASSSTRNNKKLLLKEERRKQDKELQSRYHYDISRKKQETTRWNLLLKSAKISRENTFIFSTMGLSNFLVNVSEISNKRQGL